MTLEQIIWEAKQRPSSLRESRRPSTTVDSNGCTIVKGFVVSSRASSSDSIATASSSQSQKTPGTPLSPIEEPAPGFARPSGLLYDAPELKCIKDLSSRSLHRPARSVGSIDLGVRPTRPSIEPRRSTWQQQSSSRLSKDDSIGIALAQQRPVQRSHYFEASKQPLPRCQNELFERDTRNRDSSLATTSSGPKPPTHTTNADDNAIASDSDDDDEPGAPDRVRIVGGIAAQRLRPSYAARRALNDQKSAQAHQQQQAGASTEQDCEPAQANLARMYQAESAIESSEEDDADFDDEHVAAALTLARIHRSRNSVTTRLATAAESTNDAAEDHEEGIEPGHLSVPRTKFIPAKAGAQAIMRSPSQESRPLRPSRSQPPPIKGVLKNSCPRISSPSMRNLSEVEGIRRGSAPNVTRASETKATISQKSRSAVALSELLVRFTQAKDEQDSSLDEKLASTG